MTGKKVLIVEDEPVLGLELQEDLASQGFDVSPVINDGDMVLSAVLKNKPDVIVMDIKLYGFRDGIEAAGRLKGLFQIPIVYLTSYSYEEVKERASRTQPFWYVQKPYNEEKLLIVIQEALEPKVS